MILAEKSSEMSRPHGVMDFIFGLLSHRDAQGFRKSQKGDISKTNWWPTSPGYL